MGKHPTPENGPAAVDYDRRLEITIRNTRPIEPLDLSASLTALGSQFQRFVEEGMDEGLDASAQLLVKEVRSGSMVFELVAHALPYVPLMWDGGALNAWTTQFAATLQWLAGKTSDRPKDLTKQDLRQINSIVGPIAQDGGSQMNIVVSEGATIVNNFHLTSLDAGAVRDRVATELKALENADSHVQVNQVMTWYQAKFDDKSETGNKAVIESITKKPVKVIFENAEVRRQMMMGSPDIDRPWQQLAYLVDVHVQTIRGVPKLYTVRGFHPEHTFDPDED